jgi:hypothetical protein
MNLDIYKKAFPESTDIKTLHAIVEDHHKGNMVRINHKQKLILEEGYKAIGLGALNKSCKSCLAKASVKVRAYVEQYIPISTYTRVKKVVKTKVVKKASPITTEGIKDFFKEMSDESKFTGFTPDNHLKQASKKVVKVAKLKVPEKLDVDYSTGEDSIEMIEVNFKEGTKEPFLNEVVKHPTDMKWAELKKYATSKGVKVYKKNKEQILKELGV